MNVGQGGRGPWDCPSCKVLIIDDSKTNVDVLVQLLKGYCELGVALSGEKGLRYVHTHKPDLILLDVVMPGMDGFEVCKRLKGDPSSSGLPIIFITALDGVGDMTKGLELGAVDYITKPFEPAEVRAKVKTHLQLRKMNELLQRQKEMLEKKSSQLEQSNRRLKELDRLKSDFLSLAAHELRTPMTSIIGFAKLIDKDLGRMVKSQGSCFSKATKIDRVVSNLGVILSEGDRLLRLVNNVLDLTKMESGFMEWADRKISCRELIETAVNASRGIYGNLPSLELVAAYPPEPGPMLVVDPDRIGQVLINLLSNAAKFTPSGEVGIEAGVADGEWVRFSVWDTGVGLAANDLEGIFEKYRQAGDEAARGGKGTGLGLAICKRIVEHYGGRIWAESEPGKGARIIFDLPLAG